MEDSYVKIMTCKFCGNKTDTIALNCTLEPIKGDAFDTEPCKACKARFKTHMYFIGDCGHSGFIKAKALKNIISKEGAAEIGDSKMFRIEKCFVCMGDIDIEKCETI